MNLFLSTILLLLLVLFAALAETTTATSSIDNNEGTETEDHRQHFVRNARVTCKGLDTNSHKGFPLNELDFLAYALRMAFNSVHYSTRPGDNNEGNGLVVEASEVLELDQEKEGDNNDDDDRSLRTRRLWTYYDYWNVYLTVMWTCRGCPYETRKLRSRNNGRVSSSTDDDDSDDEGKNGNNRERASNNNVDKANNDSIWRNHRRFELLLSEILREGPYELFQSIDNCRVIYLPE